jgi:mono/diheme cytochrome c family protein
MKAVLRALLLLIVIGAIAAGAVAYAITARGLSTRVAPSALEERLALTLRHLATPAALRSRQNPVEPTAAVLDEALEHFADHCAACHANDGSGNTEIGRNLYPPAPDMRTARTQGLSDGELFSSIVTGIRLTGMPAWGTGTPEGEQGSWARVHFHRRRPQLPADDLVRREGLNPKSPPTFREEEEERRFLAGDDKPPAAPAQPPHKEHE